MKFALVSVSVGALATAFATQASAAPRNQGFLDLYYVPKAELDVTIPGVGSGDDDGNGFGARGLARLGSSLGLVAEYQSTGYDDSDLDIDQIRVGLGIFGESTSGVYVEYDNMELEGDDADGFSAHARLAGGNPELQLYGDIAYMEIEDDFEKNTGLEYLVGISFSFSPGGAGLFVDYRVTDLEGEDSEIEVKFSDARVGLRIPF